jgi:hypothetical protein
MLVPRVAAYALAAATAEGSNDAGGTLGVTDAAAELPAEADATGAEELPAAVEAAGAVVAVPLPQAAKTIPAVASSTPLRIPNLEWLVTLGLLSS